MRIPASPLSLLPPLAEEDGEDQEEDAAPCADDEDVALDPVPESRFHRGAASERDRSDQQAETPEKSTGSICTGNIESRLEQCSSSPPPAPLAPPNLPAVQELSDASLHTVDQQEQDGKIAVHHPQQGEGQTTEPIATGSDSSRDEAEKEPAETDPSAADADSAAEQSKESRSAADDESAAEDRESGCSAAYSADDQQSGVTDSESTQSTGDEPAAAAAAAEGDAGDAAGGAAEQRPSVCAELARPICRLSHHPATLDEYSDFEESVADPDTPTGR